MIVMFARKKRSGFGGAGEELSFWFRREVECVKWSGALQLLNNESRACDFEKARFSFDFHWSHDFTWHLSLSHPPSGTLTAISLITSRNQEYGRQKLPFSSGTTIDVNVKIPRGEKEKKEACLGCLLWRKFLSPRVNLERQKLRKIVMEVGRKEKSDPLLSAKFGFLSMVSSGKN